MSKLFIPKDAIDELLILVSAKTEQLQQLTELFNSVEATSPESYEFVSKTADILNLSIEDAYNVVRLVNFVSHQKKSLESSNDQFISEITTTVQNTEHKDVKKALSSPPQREAFLNLFGPKPVAELAKKKEKLETGLLKSLTNIEGTCDLRPVFNIERSHIVDKVLTVIARLSLKDDKDNEDHLVFQLNSGSLEKLKKFLEITNKKIQIMEREIKPVEP